MLLCQVAGNEAGNKRNNNERSTFMTRIYENHIVHSIERHNTFVISYKLSMDEADELLVFVEGGWGLF